MLNDEIRIDVVAICCFCHLFFSFMKMPTKLVWYWELEIQKSDYFIEHFCFPFLSNEILNCVSSIFLVYSLNKIIKAKQKWKKKITGNTWCCEYFACFDIRNMIFSFYLCEVKVIIWKFILTNLLRS